jgi:hypothetical protein
LGKVIANGDLGKDVDGRINSLYFGTIPTLSLSN